jgi:hypothetical protein
LASPTRMTTTKPGPRAVSTAIVWLVGQNLALQSQNTLYHSPIFVHAVSLTLQAKHYIFSNKLWNTIIFSLNWGPVGMM